MYFKGINLTNLNNCEIYDLVLKRKIPNFPPGFWCSISKEEGRKIALHLLQHLIEKKLKLEREEIMKELSKDFILNNKLWTPCKLYFGRSAVRYLMELYPHKFSAFKFVKCRIPQSYWCSRENRIAAIKWLFEEKLQWSLEDIKDKFHRSMLIEYGLATLTTYYYSSFEIINEIYPDKIYPWELKRSSVPPRYWDVKGNRILAVKWLIKDKLKFSHEEVINDLSLDDFSQSRLSTLIYEYYNKSIARAVVEAFEDEYMPWEFGYHRWNIDEARKATKWLIEKLRRKKGKSPLEINYYDFQDNKLRIVIDKYYGSSPRKAVLDLL